MEQSYGCGNSRTIGGATETRVRSRSPDRVERCQNLGDFALHVREGTRYDTETTFPHALWNLDVNFYIRRKPLSPAGARKLLLIVIVLFALSVVALVAATPRCAQDLIDGQAYRNDPSCARPPAATGHCTVVTARISDSDIDTVETRQGEELHYDLVVALEGGGRRRVEVGQPLYDAQLVSGRSVSAQLFNGLPVRLTIGDTSGETSDSPGGRLNADGAWPLVSLLCVFAFGLSPLGARRIITKAKAAGAL